jgi:lipocalin-like protein
MRIRTMVLVLLLASIRSWAGSAAHAADQRVIGTWRLISFATEDAETGAVAKPWGERPTGFLTYTPGGRMSAVLTADGRKPEADGRGAMPGRAELFMTMAAYAGTYTLTADGVVHHVEVASFPEWVGGAQVRYATLEGETLTIKTPPLPRFPDGRKQIFTLIWRRVE